MVFVICHVFDELVRVTASSHPFRPVRPNRDNGTHTFHITNVAAAVASTVFHARAGGRDGIVRIVARRAIAVEVPGMCVVVVVVAAALMIWRGYIRGGMWSTTHDKIW
eukprot:scaffold9441_cov167-Amphora_coffeaeformis.AAC.1